MTDVVFFLKAMPPAGASSLPWPGPVALIPLSPPVSGEPTSTDFANLAASLKDGDGRILPNLLAHYAKGLDVERVAFVGFSAAHGFLDPFARNADDRHATSAYVLMDATFDGFGATHGKPGYVAFASEAAAGDRLLVTTTANSATWDPVAKKTTHLTGTESFKLVWSDLLAAGLSDSAGAVREPMPEPAAGVHQMGPDLVWYEYVLPNGESQIQHTDMGKLILPVLTAYLVPYWRGELKGTRGFGKILLAIGAGALAAWVWLRRRK